MRRKYIHSFRFGDRVLATAENKFNLIPGEPGVICEVRGLPLPYLVQFKNYKYGSVWVEAAEIRPFNPRPKNNRVYICSAFGGKQYNLKLAGDYGIFAIQRGRLPIIPHLYLSAMLDDNNPHDRQVGMAFGIDLLKICHELWVFDNGEISEGMRAEIEYWRRHINKRMRTFKISETGDIVNA